MRIGLFLFLVLGIALVPCISFALTVSVADVAGAPGQTIPVTITAKDISADQHISGIDFALDYNEGALLVSSVDRGTLTADWNTLPNMNQPGKVKVGLYTVKPLAAGDGSILVITFTVKDNAQAGKFPLHVSQADFNEKHADTVSDAAFTIAAGAPMPARVQAAAAAMGTKLHQTTVFGILKTAEFRLDVGAVKPGTLQISKRSLPSGVFVTGFDAAQGTLSLLSFGTSARQGSVEVTGTTAQGAPITRKFDLKID